MKTYIRMQGNRVVEVFNNTTELSIEELFHADVQFIECDVPDISSGYTRQEDGSFLAPEPVSVSEPISVV
jgi:hypothetical protein